MDKRTNERLNKIEDAVFRMAIAMGRLDLLQEAGWEFMVTDTETGEELPQFEVETAPND